jgi:hypothetical protein
MDMNKRLGLAHNWAISNGIRAVALLYAISAASRSYFGVDE